MTALIPLRGRRNEIKAYAVIDAGDVEWVSQWRWALHSMGGYAMRHVGILLHREVLGLKPGDGMEGDHVDRDRLNCRRSNLRPIPAFTGNRQNLTPKTSGTSSFRGVSWHPSSGKWRARLWKEGKTLSLGVFDSEQEAANAALEARLQLMPYAVD